MSTEIYKEISCPKCGAEVKTQMWSGINAEVNPNLRMEVLDEVLFDWTCPECGYEAQLAYPCLYHDKSRKFMVYVVPNGNSRDLQSINVKEVFPQLRDVRKRVVTSLAELKEKVLIFEAGLDDRAVELVKLALASVVGKKYGKKAVEGYYCFADEPENRIGFSFFLEGESVPVRQGTRFDVYKKSLEIVQNTAKDDGTKEFSPVNAQTAQVLLNEYQKSGA